MTGGRGREAPLLGTMATHLVAYDLLELALGAASTAEAWPLLEVELEVLPRPDLIRVAMAVTVEATRNVLAVRDRDRFRRRLELRRLEAMTHDDDAEVGR